MKEAFELIKERLRAKKDNLAHNLQLFKDKKMRDMVSVCETKLDAYIDALSIVYEVEAEYENDVCEWHKCRNGNAYQCNTHADIHDSRVLDWYVCPYCEKKIKVVE